MHTVPAGLYTHIYMFYTTPSWLGYCTGIMHKNIIKYIIRHDIIFNYSTIKIVPEGSSGGPAGSQVENTPMW